MYTNTMLSDGIEGNKLRCLLFVRTQGPIALNQFPTGKRTPDNPLAKDSTAQAKLYNMTERIIADVNQKRHGSRTAEQ